MFFRKGRSLDVNGIVVGWILGVFSQVIADDRNAIILTRHQILELEGIINKITNVLKNPQRSGNYDYDLVLQFKGALQHLECAYSGVFIKMPELSRILNQGFCLIKNSTQFQNRATSILCTLITQWTFSEDGLPPLNFVKQSLYGGAFKRIVNGLKFYCIKLSQKFRS